MASKSRDGMTQISLISCNSMMYQWLTVSWGWVLYQNHTFHARLQQCNYIVLSTAQSDETNRLRLPIYPDIPGGPSSEPEIASKHSRNSRQLAPQAPAGFTTSILGITMDHSSCPLLANEQSFHSWISQLSNRIQRCWLLSLFKLSVVKLASGLHAPLNWKNTASPGYEGMSSSDQLACLHRTLHCQPVTI